MNPPAVVCTGHYRGLRRHQRRGCPRHAVAALDGIAGAHVDWADSKGINEYERTALDLTEERSQLRVWAEAKPGSKIGHV